MNLLQGSDARCSERVSVFSLAIHMWIQNGERKEHGTIDRQYIQNNLLIQTIDIYR